MRTLRMLGTLAPLCFTTVACTAILGGFDFEGKPVGTGGTGGTGGGVTHTGGAGGGGTDGGNEASTPLTVTPEMAKAGALRALQLSASDPVTWSVQEPNGGKVDAGGRYVSPEQPGTYHVVATRNSDGSTATAEITVVPLGVTILTNSGGSGNVDGPAPRAHFNNPAGAAYAAAPNDALVIADSDNHTIRKYDPTTQKMTTLAGVAGVSGTASGTGSAARFNRPTNVVVNAQVAYVSDTDNNCIRAVGIATGDVATLAGQCGAGLTTADATLGADARFDAPGSITVNNAHSALYVCDSGSIRRVDLATGATKTVIPNVPGCHMGPIGNQLGFPIYYAGNGSLHRFKEGAAPDYTPTVEDLATLPVSECVGLGDHDGQSLYMADRTSIYLFDENALTFGSGPVVGQSGQPGYADGTGNAARFVFIGGLAGAPSLNRLYIVDSGLRAIREVQMNTLAVSTKIGAPDIVDRVDGSKDVARLTLPLGLAPDASGALYVADATADNGSGKTLNSTIRFRDAQSGAISSFAGVPAIPGSPIDGPATVAKFSMPFDVVRDGEDLYVADALASAIRKVAKDGMVSTIAGELGVAGTSDGFGIAAHFAAPFALTSDHKGNLYVGDVVSIRKIAIATGEVTTIAGGTPGSANGIGKNAQFQNIWGLAIDGNTLYIADSGDNTIRAMDLGTAEVKAFVGSSGNSGYKDGDVGTALFDHPARIVADGLGNLFVAELGPQFLSSPLGTIRRIDIATRTTSTFAGTRGALGLAPGPLGTATLNCPSALTLMPNGDLAFGDACDHAIAVISPL